MTDTWELPPSVETQSIERVGGSFAWESGVYDAVVSMAYLDQSKGGAVSLNVILKNAQGKELKESMWIKSGDKKGNKTYYTDKDGKDRPLPGYSVANSLCVSAMGKSLADAMKTPEKKIVNIYNYEQSKEVPTERPVLVELINKPVKVAVHQILENKNVKDDSGNYVPGPDTRTVNEFKFFGNTAGLTAEEILAEGEAVMFDKWAAKNTGTVIDKTVKKDNAATSAASIMGASAATDDTATTGSLFG